MTCPQFEAIRTRSFLLDQLANFSVDPSSSSLAYLLPPCLILLAIDVAVRLSHRTPPATVLMDDKADSSKCDGTVADRVSHRAHKLLNDFSRLEANISAEMVRSRQLCRTLEKRRNFAHHRHRLETYNVRHGPHSCTQKSQKGVSKPFETFCRRLLLQNKIWSQQKQIKALRGSLDSAQSAQSSSAFKAFCDRLLLSNRIWKLQEEAKRLKEEAEQLKRSRVAAVTRAAKQMVQDVRKERLTEEFVKDLLVEVGEHKRALATLKAEHEKEMAEMAEGWKGDYQRLCKEIEHLQLAQDARLMEQELSNQVETDLLERLMAQEQKGDATHSEELIEDDSVTLSGDTDCEQSSNLSTSTFVGSVGQCSPNNKLAFDGPSLKTRRSTVDLSPLQLPRRRTISLASVDSAKSLIKTPIRRLAPEPYVGFSFNPLFFGTPSISRKDGTLKVESPTNVADLGFKLPPRPVKPSPSNPKGKHVPQTATKSPWRL